LLGDILPNFDSVRNIDYFVAFIGHYSAIKLCSLDHISVDSVWMSKVKTSH